MGRTRRAERGSAILPLSAEDARRSYLILLIAPNFRTVNSPNETIELDFCEIEVALLFITD
jgi:hypothetical protein